VNDMKPLYAWALATRGEIGSITDLCETRDDALAYQNKPAGQRVVQVKIIEVKPKKSSRLRRLGGKPINALAAAISKPRTMRERR
jgi:hypothetical protein